MRNDQLRKRTDLIVIHCSATTDKMDIGVKEIDAWHRERGFRKVGYHFVIRRNGMVELGREIDEIGAHAEGHNSNSVAICLVGGVDANDTKKAKDNFTDAQWDTLLRLVKELQEKYPTAKVLGHRDLPGVQKACPSFDVTMWLTKVAFE